MDSKPRNLVFQDAAVAIKKSLGLGLMASTGPIPTRRMLGFKRKAAVVGAVTEKKRARRKTRTRIAYASKRKNRKAA